MAKCQFAYVYKNPFAIDDGKANEKKNERKKILRSKLYAGDIFHISCMLNCDPTDFCL